MNTENMEKIQIELNVLKEHLMSMASDIQNWQDAAVTEESTSHFIDESLTLDYHHLDDLFNELYSIVDEEFYNDEDGFYNEDRKDALYEVYEPEGGE